MKLSRITGCYLVPRDDQQGAMFSGGGSICVNLSGYAVIPMEQYQRLLELAELGAASIARSLLARAKGEG